MVGIMFYKCVKSQIDCPTVGKPLQKKAEGKHSDEITFPFFKRKIKQKPSNSRIKKGGHESNERLEAEWCDSNEAGQL